MDSKKRALNYFTELSNGTLMWLGEENLETIVHDHIDDKSMAMSALQKFNENRVDVENEIINQFEPFLDKEMETKEKKGKIVKFFRTAKTWIEDYMERLWLLPNFLFLKEEE